MEEHLIVFSAADTLRNVTENFCYDALNRLTNYGINGSEANTGT